MCVCGRVLFRNAGSTQGVNRKGMQHLCLANDQMVRFSIWEILNFKRLRILVNKTKLVGIYFALSSSTILRCPTSSHGNSGTLSSYGTCQQTQKAGSGKEAKGLSHSTFSRPTPLTLEFGIPQSGLLESKSLSEGHIASQLQSYTVGHLPHKYSICLSILIAHFYMHRTRTFCLIRT